MAPASKFTNPQLVKGVPAVGRAQAFSKSGAWRFVKKGPAGKKTEAKPKAAAGKKIKASSTQIAKLKQGLVPGSVVIVLAGRFQGKRVVVLKQLASSGLLLVSGPFEVNGVPVRRINQSYVITTSQKVDLTGVDASKIDDAYFKRIANDATTKLPKPEAYAKWLAARKEVQKQIDSALLKNIAATPMLKEYLGARFSLQNGQLPHLMKF